MSKENKSIGNINTRTALKAIGTFTSLLLAFVMLTGCGGAAKSAASYTVSETAASYEGEYNGSGIMRNEAYAEEAGVDYDSMADTASGAYDKGTGVSGGTTEPLSESEIEAAGASGEQTAASRKLIKTVTLNTQTTEFDKAVASIDAQVKSYGGYVENSSLYKGGYHESSYYSRSADYTIRMPADKLDAFLGEALGELHVTNRSENVEDITLRYTDLESRVKALETEQERLFELMTKAENVDAIIAIESRLSEIRYELESIKSSLRSYDNQVVYSTVYLYINEVKLTSTTGEASFSDKIVYGLKNNLIGLGEMLESLVIFIITELPVIIVLGALLAVFVFIVRKIVRAIRRRIVSLRDGKKNSKRTGAAVGVNSTQANGNEADADTHADKTHDEADS